MGTTSRITPLRAEHLPAAARIFAQRLDTQRQAVPCLPERAPDAVVQQLARMVETQPAVAAIDNGRLVGYMSGWCIDAFQGPEGGVYCPEWAVGCTGPDRGRTLRRLYSRLAVDWAAAGCANHAVTLLAGDHSAREALWWLGFGVRVVDALRDLTPLGNDRPDGLTMRLLEPEDAEVLAPLADALAEHVAAPPTSVYVPRGCDAAYHRSWLAEPGHWVWLAEVAGAPVGYLRAQAETDDVAWVVQAADVLAVSGAYVLPEYRGRGMATALLDTALAHARALGKAACSVDFESQNETAVGFWLRHFAPVCVSVLRRVDPRSGMTGQVNRPALPE